MPVSPPLLSRLTSGWLRHLGPAMAFVGRWETLRASLGILLGMVGLTLVLQPIASPEARGLFLIAPFGASAVLVFALPNSPLAQPWSAVFGNFISALVTLGLMQAMTDPVWLTILAPPLAILAMHLTRSLHPPGGAVALSMVFSPAPVLALGWAYPLIPVAFGTGLLVAIATLYGRATGRHYPFRQPAGAVASSGKDIPVTERIGVSRAELAQLLQEFQQSANIGVEDLARLISATEILAASHQSNRIPLSQIMSRDLVTVLPNTPLGDVAEIFRTHGFTSLPVVDATGNYLGVIFQIHLIRRGQEDARRTASRLDQALARILRRNLEHPIRAEEVMAATLPSLPADAPLEAALPLLAQGPNDAVPVLEGSRIIGIVTRTDLIAALALRRG